MAIRRSQNWLNQQRVDTPHLRSLESAIRNDFDELLAGLITGIGKPFILNGFEISVAGAIGSSATGLQVLVEESAILNGNSQESGTFFIVPKGTPNETLNATTNTRVEGSFTPGALNYIGIEYTRQVNDETMGQVYFWNPTNDSEFVKTVPLALTFDYKFVITSSLWTDNVVPLATIETDGANNVLSIEDNRPLYHRLGTAGKATPDPTYSYPWDNQPEGRVENFYKTTSSASSPFRGGDKQIRSEKEWKDAIMSMIKEIKGTNYWYSENTGGSLVKNRIDGVNLSMTGRGDIAHHTLNAGQMNWSNDIFFNIIGSRLNFKIDANPTSANLTLGENQVAYVNLVREVNITPSLVFVNNGVEVKSVGNVPWTNDVREGDFIKVASKTEAKYYQILTIDDLSTITLSEVYQEEDTGVVGTQAQYAYGSYEVSASPSSDRHVHIALREEVPFNQDMFWFFFRQDNGGSVAKVYIRGDSELQQGESRDVDDSTSHQVLSYIGSPSEATSIPTYSEDAIDSLLGQTNYNSVQENLTSRVSKLTSMVADKAQDKTLKYAENFNSVNNITNGSAQEISFIGIGVPTLDVILPSSINFKNTITLDGILSLQENEVAYFLIDRNNGFSLASLSELTITTLDLLPLGENVYVFAYRLNDVAVFLYSNKKLKLGGNPLASGAGVVKADLHDPISTALPLGNVVVDGVVVQDKDRVLFTNLSPDLNRIYSAIDSGGGVIPANVEVMNTLAKGVVISYGNGMYVMFPSGGNIGYYSSDLVNWTTVTLPSFGAGWKIAFGESANCFIAISGNGAIIRSIDGITWTSIILPNMPSSLAEITYGWNGFVVVQRMAASFPDGAIFHSIDGITWTTHADTGVLNGFSCFGLSSFSSTLGTSYMAIGTGGTLYSLDGMNWVNVSPLSNGQHITSIEDVGYFAISGANLVYKYNSTWDLLSSVPNTYGNVRALVSGNNLLVAITHNNASQGAIYTSINGIDWVLINNSPNFFVDCVYAQGKFVCISENLSTPENIVRVTPSQTTTSTIIGWNPEYDFGGFQDPSDGDFVVVTRGVLFEDQLGKFNGTNFVFNDKVRYFNGTDYFEQSNLIPSLISNNVIVPQLISEFNVLGSEYSFVEYSISRGTSRESGMLIITSDGSDVGFTQFGANISLTGVTLDVDVLGGKLRILYTSDNSGSSGEMKFNIRRWSNSAGGPSGVPSYTGGGGGGSAGGGDVTSSGVPNNGEIAIFTSPKNITSNANFKFDTALQSINLNGMYIGALQTYNLLDNTTNDIFSVDATLFPFLIINYSLLRNGKRRCSTLHITHDGVDVEISDLGTSVSDLGVDFVGELLGGNLVLKGITTSTTYNITMKASITRWS